MKTHTSSARYRWGFTFAVTNLAVLTVLLVLLAAGQIRNHRDFLYTLAYSLVFSNLTSVLAMLVIGPVLERLAKRRLPMVPVSIIAIVVIIPLGCLAAQTVLVLIRFVPADHFWAQYLHILKVASPLGVVFGLGALAYATLRGRLEETELRLHEKELSEERTRKLAAETRLRSLESWIHPHFLFNTLNSISALIPQDPARAEQIIGRLATLLRASLDTGTLSLIPLHQELALVESYLDIERVRLGEKLHATIEVPAALAGTKVPPMSIQHLVENAVKYGITPQPNGGELLVIASTNNGANGARGPHGARGPDIVSIEIRDSGPGFDLAAIPANHGLDKLTQRLDALYGDNASLKVFCRDNISIVQMTVPRS